MNEGTRWPRATKERPCPKCGKTNRCLIAPDGTGGICWRSGSKDVWQDPKPASSNGSRRQHTDRPRPVAPEDGKTFATPGDAIAAAQQQIEADHPGTRLTNFWFYQNRGGADVMIVARYDDADGDKHFRPMHPHKSGWRIGDPPGPLPIYRLTELAETGQIYICEGEKAADAAVKLGLEATTSAHGAASADKSDWTSLAQHAGQIVILPDNDDPGRKYARDVARQLFRANRGIQVKIVELPDLPERGDIVEFVEAGGTREQIDSLVAIATVIDASEIIGGPVLTCMADIDAVEIKWLWIGHIPLGRITMLSGRPGEGKSFLTCDLVARVSTGSPQPDDTPCPLGSAILICAEDDPGDTIRQRLDGAHADVSKIHLLTMVKRHTEGGMTETLFTLTDLAALDMALKALPDCLLIVIDPIGSYLGGRIDAHRDNEVRSVLAPVAALAAKYGLAVLIVCHTRKASSSAADDTILGSRAFTGLARSVWHLSRDKDNRDRRLFLPGKCNLTKQPNGMAFTIGGDPPCITWERDPLKLHADDVMEQPGTPGPEPEARVAAEEWLLDLLANGPVLSGDLSNPEPGTIRAMAKDADFKWKTIRNAADHLGIRRERDRFNKKFVWRLPKHAKTCCPPSPEAKQQRQHGQQEDQYGKTEPKIGTPNHVAQEDSAKATCTPTETPEDDPSGEIPVIDLPGGGSAELDPAGGVL